MKLLTDGVQKLPDYDRSSLRFACLSMPVTLVEYRKPAAGNVWLKYNWCFFRHLHRPDSGQAVSEILFSVLRSVVMIFIKLLMCTVAFRVSVASTLYPEMIPVKMVVFTSYVFFQISGKKPCYDTGYTWKYTIHQRIR